MSLARYEPTLRETSELRTADWDSGLRTGAKAARPPRRSGAVGDIRAREGAVCACLRLKARFQVGVVTNASSEQCRLSVPPVRAPGKSRFAPTRSPSRR